MYPSHFKANLSSNNKLWAKLLDLHPDKENIRLFTKPIKNSAHPKWKMSEKTTLNLVETTSISGLKRKRDEIDELNLPQICNKLIKIQKETLQKEFTCDLCKEIVLSFAALSPCSHKLCNECLTDFLKYSKKCPLCSKKTKSSTQSIAPELKTSPLTPKESKENSNFNFQKERIYYEDGSSYEGHFKNNKKEGKGRLTLKTGDIYKGTWIDDVLQPVVKIKYLDGNGTYKGEVKDFKRHGKGVFTCGETIYEGFWENDRRNGWGKEINGGSSTYEGHWRNDKQHGHGKLKLKSGVFEGNWINGRISGYGAVSLQAKKEETGVKFLKKNGLSQKEYEGYWINGEIQMDRSGIRIEEKKMGSWLWKMECRSKEGGEMKRDK